MRLRSRIPLAALLIASSAFAAPPATCDFVSPPNCTLPGGITMVLGSTATGVFVPDPAGAFTITLRNAASQPIPDCNVMLDLSSCTEFQFCAGSVPPPRCPGPQFDGKTDATGNAHFDIVGFVLPGTPNNTGTTFPCAKVTAGSNHVLLGFVPVACADLDGSGAVNSLDINVLTGLFATGLALRRGDFDFSGAIGPADFQILTGIATTGRSISTGGGPCCH